MSDKIMPGIIGSMFLKAKFSGALIQKSEIPAEIIITGTTAPSFKKYERLYEMSSGTSIPGTAMDAAL